MAAAAAAPTNSSSHSPLVVLDAPALLSLLPPSALIPHLRSTLPALSSSVRAPLRHSHPLSQGEAAPPSLLLLMPCWSLDPSLLPYLGVKIVTVTPSVRASYSLFSSPGGLPLASLDGTLLTLLRTSAASALASLLLSRPSSSTLVLLGAGALAPHLVSAHRVARPGLTRFLLWNRTPEKASHLASQLQLQHPGVLFQVADDVDEAVAAGDIVCCATGSRTPLVKGERLKRGAHLNMVGSFTPEMRECDDEAVRRGRVFVDSEDAFREAGELVGALERGVISREDVAGTLADLAAGRVVGRRGEEEEEVTVFKSVGTAVFDLLTAQLAYESFLKGSENTSEVPTY
ncbi:putative delta(1)-pyrroline-2-carboxylate reductase [Iris pallida]|uniref:Delta(1)-pyrroline-2-carboxylate reductase n=1 Tax=Iris pallida TaxID=29817 RepID=A0AAX6EKX8_IRIPA|nr:putative delta(1)-pyrroline-2-carboxylate reductase [Iris pallida]